MIEEERPGTAARLLAAIEETEEEPVENYRERVTETMRSMLGCIQEFLVGVGKSTSPRIARAKLVKAARAGGTSRDVREGCRRPVPVGCNRGAR